MRPSLLTKPGKRGLLAAGIACFLLACGDAAAPMATGSLEVVTTTDGQNLDEDGYTASVDGSAEVATPASGNTVIADLALGDHSIRLSGLASNCSLGGPNPVTASVTPGETTRVTFDVTCAGSTGSVEVTVITTGAAVDPDGYLVTLDTTPAQTVGVQASVLAEGLSPGGHEVFLSDLAPNCAVDGDNPAQVSVTPSATAAVTFLVACRGPMSSGGILFESGRAAVFPRYHLYRMDPNGSDVVDLTPTSDGQDGRWSLDRSKIAFTSYRGGNADIYLMNSDGTGVTRLTNNSADDTEPVWSPDGRKIAFVSTRTGGSNVYTMNADGSAQTPLTGVSGGFEPSWSPNGNSIAFSRVVRLCRFDVCIADIFIVPAAGGAAYNVTRNSDGVALDPAWSPDGSRIAYSLNRQLYTVRPDGTGATRISEDPAAQDVAPVWSPDGSKLAFTRYLGDSQVFVMNADGTGAINLSSQSGSGTASDWR